MIRENDKARLEEQLALSDLLISLAEQGTARQRLMAEQPHLAGDALAKALTELALIESTEALRKAERKRLLAALRPI